ncbi:MAG: [Fe-Fe] hydrogenase large subunit C-terminal domain-containing protein [Victivallales bacterium]|nr:4Fe-4S binding protein [bacterium]MDY5694750.1 [Fe-Fe] hydrogenase large subunit C-terminal domain-containing protein [Victivallales bacterium]
MNQNFPIYTTANECQDCYKCVRHCHCKAIRIVNARAAVIPELCVSCGECVKVCPAEAKKIRSDLSRAQYLLHSGAKVYASIAPSYVGYFKDIPIGRLAAALKRLGFVGASETAIGAQFVSAQTAELLKQAGPGVYLSTACPASVDFIRKYYPAWTDNFLPVSSPVMAHCKYLKQIYGDDIKIIFVGPCAAKKNEADRNPDDLSLAITFAALESWLKSEGISLDKMNEEPLVPVQAEEGRVYSIEGGMNETLRSPEVDARLLAVSGLPNIARLIEKVDLATLKESGSKIFVEMLACDGGCVNGPVMGRESSRIDILLETAAHAPHRSSVGREVPVNIQQLIYPDRHSEPQPEEAAILQALHRIGKYSAEDELNCGGCGYNSCREFAKAMLDGKAETSMCLSYLRKISQKTSNALIRYIPVAVVLAGQDLQVIECNRHFAELCGEDTLLAFDACGNLNGAYLDSMIDFTDLFESVLANGGEIEKFNQVSGEKILNISVFTINEGQTVGAVIQDVTQNELKREQIAERAKEVIRKNVMTVQKIARYLGEHMADTEILLKEVAGTYTDHKDGKETERK